MLICIVCLLSEFFNDIIRNVSKNFVLNEFITRNDRDPHRIDDNKTESNGKIVCTEIIRKMAKKLRNMNS